MTNRVQTLRSSVAGNRPANGTRAVGELYANFPDLQFGVIDTAQAAVDLLPVRYFSTLANYVAGDFVVQSGQLYRANGAIAAGPFNPAQWTQGTGAGVYMPLAGGAFTGPVSGTDATFGGTVVTQVLDATDATFGGTVVTRVLDGVDATFSGTVVASGVLDAGAINAATLVTTGAVDAGGGISTTALNAATLVTTGQITCNGGHVNVEQTTGDNYSFQLNNSAGAFTGSFACRGATDSAVGIFTNYGGGSLYLDVSGNFYYAGGTGTATKIGGGTWAAPSDARIKTVQSEYAPGLDEVLQLRPVIYTYKGNHTPAPDAPSPAKQVADTSTPFVGLIAQEVEAVFPDMVTEGQGWIDGAQVDDLRTLDTSALVFALVNAVKTLTARIEALEAA